MKKTLIVIDMQNDFIDMALGTPEAVAIVPKVRAKIREYVKNGDEILYTRDTHGADYLDTPEGKKLPVPHCIRETDGWQIRPEVKAAMGDAILVEKPTFGSVRLPEIIAAQAEDTNQMTIELIGLCTDICVVSNTLLLKACYPDADIRVRQSCCAGVTPHKHEAALETMRSCQIDVI